MDKFKILFYIVIGIIYFISKAYSSEKNKQNKRSLEKKPVNRKTAEDIFEDLRKQFNLPESNLPSVPKPMLDRPEPINYESPTSAYQKMTKTKLVLEREPKRKRKSIIFKETEETQDENMFVSKRNSVLDGFDGRKAVIFSEILKRPEY